MADVIPRHAPVCVCACMAGVICRHAPVCACACLQVYADNLASEYVRHFTQQELVIGAAAEARLAKTLVKRVTLADTLAVAAEMRSSCSCIVKVEHHWKAVTEAQLLEVCASSMHAARLACS